MTTESVVPEVLHPWTIYLRASEEAPVRVCSMPERLSIHTSRARSPVPSKQAIISPAHTASRHRGAIRKPWDLAARRGRSSRNHG